MKELLKNNEKLMLEYNYFKNKDVNLSQITIGSGKKIWWKCNKGHEWQANPRDRIRGNGCPYCSGKKILVGFNDLTTTFPNLIKEWNYKKNVGINPNEVSAGSNKKVWWKCSKGHEWQAIIANRSKGKGCPYCSGRYATPGENDLITIKFDFLKEWDYEKNKEVDPGHISINSNKKVWWKCSKGHEWQARINQRSKYRTACPYCSNYKVLKGFNDLETTFPNLIKEWNYKKNVGINPNEVSAGSNKKVWWKCSKGHEWQAIISNRAKGQGCPYCSGRYVIEGKNDFQTLHPELIKEWDYEKNKGLFPNKLLPSVNKKVWWKCSKGHEWQASLNSRVKSFKKGTNCPYCSSELQTSYPEQILFYYLSKQFKTINREKLFNKEIDIFLPDLFCGIEYDGIRFHSSKLSLKREQDKNKVMKENNIFLIRVKESLNNNLFDKKNNIIYYKYDNNYNKLKFVINVLNDLLNKKYNLNVKIDFNLERDHVEILKKFVSYQKENSIAKKNKFLLSEWNYEKNKNMNPDFFDINSNKKVWWKCSKCGREWQAVISSRNSGKGCPYCSGNRVIEGENDFQTLHSDLMKKWNYEKNKEIKPNLIHSKSGMKVWWKCSKGHEWKACICDVVVGNGCPYCSNKKVLKGFNDLKTWCINNNHMELINEFDNKKNNFKMDEVLFGSSKKAWWKCVNNHSYQASITNRTRRLLGCPYCSSHKILEGFNDFATRYPELMKEWDYEKNKEINPNLLFPNSTLRVGWKCPKCGYEWQAQICNRIHGTSCPKCAMKK